MTADDMPAETASDGPPPPSDTESATATVSVAEPAPEPAAPVPAAPVPAAPPAPVVLSALDIELSALDAGLDEARDAVYTAIADWLTATWEQPIIRALGANASRSIDNADHFPALRAALRGLQAGARQTAEDAVSPLLGSDVQLRDQALISSVDAVVLQLAGLVGVALRDEGFDPLSGGLERVADGFRLKTMTEHSQISSALQTYSGLKASRTAERAEIIERERQSARTEVERLWAATADVD